MAKLRPCGTVAAYRRHQRRPDAPCEACRAAWAIHQRNMYTNRKTKQDG